MKLAARCTAYQLQRTQQIRVRGPLVPCAVVSWHEMSERAEFLFRRLQNPDAIPALIGHPEDGDFDCKVWGNLGPMRGSIAKAACGFANATGGVIVIGMRAAGAGSNTPDVVREEAPVANPDAVKSAVLDMILKGVEPGIQGVQAQVVPLVAESDSGFLLVYIPETDGPPQRSRVDSKFYVRIASGTIPMEYFQIEDRFGRRPHANLVIEVMHDSFGQSGLQHGVRIRKLLETVS